MNFLAHILLSGDNDQIRIGNFMADAIKGKNYLNYPKYIKTGILLHRKIDAFTDMHPTVKTSKKRLHQRYKHYNGVIIDIFYDHFLAKNWDKYHIIALDIFTDQFYKLALTHKEIMPDKIQGMLPYMVRDNWLYNYRFLEGIEKVLQGMNRRTDNKSHMNLAVADLQEHYLALENDFTTFFEDISAFSKEQLSILI